MCDVFTDEIRLLVDNTILQAPPAPNGVAKVLTNMQRCSGCGSYKPSPEFHVGPLQRSNTLICRDCERLKNIGQKRADMGFYRRMLKDIKTSETIQTKALHPVLSLLSENDIKYLLDTVWRMASAVSGRRDIYDLKLVRWDKKQLWTPWNCIALTREEAVVHLKMPSTQVRYTGRLLGKVSLALVQIIRNKSGRTVIHSP